MLSGCLCSDQIVPLRHVLPIQENRDPFLIRCRAGRKTLPLPEIEARQSDFPLCPPVFVWSVSTLIGMGMKTMCKFKVQ